MSTSLISCIGNRDPYDQKAPEFFGAALACVITVKPDKVTMISTGKTVENARRVKAIISRLAPDTQVDILDTGIDDPSDFGNVDLVLRKKLLSLVRTENGHQITPNLQQRSKNKSRSGKQGNGTCFVNVSSGAPQMTMCLSMLLATGFLKGRAIKVSDPQFNNAVVNPQKICRLPTKPEHIPAEAPADAAARTKILEHADFPVIKHATRMNAISLAERFDYSGARALLEQSCRPKPYRQLVIPVLSIAEHLLLLHIEDAKRIFNEVKILLAELYGVYTQHLEQALNLHPATIFYRATAIRYDTGRIDDFFRCAGLTREACLDYYVNQLAMLKHYETVVRKPEAGRSKKQPLELDLEKMQHDLPDLYAHLVVELESEPHRPFRLTTGTMLPLITFVGRLDADVQPIAEVLKSTATLAGIRNTYAHNLQETRKEDAVQANALFKKLQKVLPAQEYQTLERCDPFCICTKIAADLLRYWDQ